MTILNETISSNFSNLSLIGEGGSKLVFKAWNAIEKVVHALAMFRFPSPEDEDYSGFSEAEKIEALQNDESRILKSIEHEKSILDRLAGCENVIQLKKIVYQDSKHPIFVMPYYEKGDLESNLKSLSSQQKEKIVVDLLKGLKECHSRGVFIGDIKPSNVLLNADNNAVFSDFSHAFITDDLEQLKIDTYNLFSLVFDRMFLPNDGPTYHVIQLFLDTYTFDKAPSSKEALEWFINQQASLDLM